MKLEAALYSYLSTYAGLTAIVGTKIYPIVIPQEVTLPAITYQRLGMTQEHAMGDDPDLREVYVGIGIVSKTYSEAKDIQEQIETSLKDYSGTMGGAGGVAVSRVFLENITELYDDETDSIVVFVEFNIWADEGV